MRTSSLYDQGSSSVMEDGHFVALPFVGVIDGVSEPHDKDHPRIRFCDGRLTGGELVSRITEGFFIQQSSRQNALDLDLGDLVLEANKLTGDEFRANGLSLDETGMLPGATFAIARVSEEEVEIIQAGDCLALWATDDDEINVTSNQVRGHDDEFNGLIDRLQRRIAKEKYRIELEEATPDQSKAISEAMWPEFRLKWGKGRARDVNNPLSPKGYGLLNGQTELKKIWFRKTIQRDHLSTLLLFTDGMMPWETMKDKNDTEIARAVYAAYKKGGLPELLKVTRGTEEKFRAVGWTDAAEAAAIAVDF